MGDVMSKVHVVKQGECLSSIAGQYGFADYKVIYEHERNAEFKRRRPNPNLIYPGDELFIPDIRPKTVTLQTDQSYRIVVRLPKRKIKLRLVDTFGEPISRTDFQLLLDGAPDPKSGTTGAKGEIEAEIPFNVGTVKVVAGDESIELNVGHLNPMSHVDDKGISGIQARLANLSYYSGEVNGVLGKETEHAIRRFQLHHGMAVDGAITDELRSKLEEKHGV